MIRRIMATKQKTCKKGSGEYFAVITSTDARKSTIYTLRGPFKTRRCAIAEARKQKKRMANTVAIDIVTRDVMSEFVRIKGR